MAKPSPLEMLEATSRTFWIPISRLPAPLMEAVMSAYLCMRAIDEIEDHPALDGPTKAMLLYRVSRHLQRVCSQPTVDPGPVDWGEQRDSLADVTLRVDEWLALAPRTIAPRIWDAAAAMAERMAHWASRDWQVHAEADLDAYTFAVAGSVGLLLSDLWAWYDNTQTDRTLAVGFGRGLQAVNIMRNRADDLSRNVDFYPDGWTDADLASYASRNLRSADAYVEQLPLGPIRSCCEIPLVLAKGTLGALARGEAKLTRTEVALMVRRVDEGTVASRLEGGIDAGERGS